MARRPDFASCLMISCAALALSGVTLLAPCRTVQAAPPTQAAPQTAYDDGDGDELLEHWGDPKYSREERIQMAGGLAGFVLLGGLAWRKRARKKAQPVALTLVDVTERRKAA